MKKMFLENWPEAKRKNFRRSLISWYEENKRMLPWRENNVPYRIWVSEIMLQQTRVDTVIPYFNRFMELFPTMKDFAYAEQTKILKAWEGLGYYSRVRNLQFSVREVIEEYGGKVPTDLKTLLSLKGVGPYTAGAILSIAYNLAEPAVDGNVMRVISRNFMIADDIMKPSARKTFERLLYKLIDPDNPSSFNQGLMEIGALICTPKQPMCLLCPLQSFCEAHKIGRELEFPVKIKKNKMKKIHLASIIVENTLGEFLVEKREETGLLAGMWQFPTIAIKKDEKQEVLKLLFLKKYGLTLHIDHKKITRLKHIFSHLTWEIDVYRASISLGDLEESLRFMNQIEMSRYAFPVPYQKMWQSYRKEKVEKE